MKDTPSLETLKGRLDGSLSSLSGRCACQWQVGQIRSTFKVLSKPNCSVMLRSYYVHGWGLRPQRGSKSLTKRPQGWHCKQRPLLETEILLEQIRKWIAVMLLCGCKWDQGSTSAQSNFKALINLPCPCHLSMPLLIKGSSVISTPQRALIENL